MFFSKSSPKIYQEIKSRFFFQIKSQKIKNSSRKMWQQLKFIDKNQKNDNSNMVLTIDGEACHDQKSIADYVNQFFTTVASTLVQKLPTSLKMFDYNFEAFKEFYESNNPEGKTFYLKQKNLYLKSCYI